MKTLTPLLLIVLLAAGCGGQESPTTTESPKKTPATASPEKSPAAGSAVEGLPGAEDYPIIMTVPRDFYLGAESDSGRTRVFEREDGGGDILVQDLATLAGKPVAEVPDDVVSYIEESREDIRVESIRPVKIDDRWGQGFTIHTGVKKDLWCPIDGACFKPLPGIPLDVAVVRTPQGLLWICAEATDKARGRMREAFEVFIADIMLRKSAS